tara:strand:+ start:112 stop:684 length:573 start_codon:yes stop_codon:yes gene_type:complete
MSIRQLSNPKTQNYLEFKHDTLDDVYFPWFWNPAATPVQDLSKLGMTVPNGCADIGFYSHTILDPPHRFTGKQNRYYSKSCSPLLDDVHNILLDILYHNKIEVLCFYRICLNCVHPTGNNKPTVPHTDHDHPHKNIIVYFTDPDGGETMCEGDRFLGKEDDVILLDGIHNLRPPSQKRRIVLIATGLFQE